VAFPKKSQIELGFNHNVKYKGKIFHVQTEDSGVSNPHITTHLFEGGNILATKKTSYADIIQAENLTDVVRELMQEQHKAMLRNLINGAYDGMGVTAESAAGQPTTLPSTPSTPSIPSTLSTPSRPSTPLLQPTPKPPVRGPVPIPSVPGPLPTLGPSYPPQPAYASAAPSAAAQPNASQMPAPTAASAPPKGPSPSTYSLVAGASSTLKETVHLTPMITSLPVAPKATTSIPPSQPALANGKFPLPSRPVTPSTYSPVAAQPPPLPRTISPSPPPQTMKGTLRPESNQQRFSEATSSDLSIPSEVLVARRMVEKPVPKDTSGPTIFGEDLITEKSLDDVILSYLSGEGDKPK
jgi:hypothetical protein